MVKTNKSSPRKKHLVTVNDLLTRDDVNGMLQDLQKKKVGIKNLIIIYTDDNSANHWEITSDTTSSLAVWMLESTKMDVMDGDLND